MSRLRRVVAVACIAASTTAVVVSDPALAASPAPSGRAATYTVQNGDYLSGIASRLGVKLYSLLDTNHLQVSSLIYPGMHLTVPKGGSLPATTSSNAGAVHATDVSAPVARSSRKYLVVANDSLSGIAATLGVSLYALLAENQLSVTSLIYPGMQLSVPKGGRLPSVAPASKPTVMKPAGTSKAPRAPKAPKAPLVYVVLSGDGLSVIAQRLGVSLPSLLDTNDMTVTSFIYPGMRLTVPSGGSLPAPAAAPATTPTSKLSNPGPTTTTPGTTTTVTVPTPIATPKVIAKLQPMMNFAIAQQGKPYKFNTAGPNTYDCSGLAMAAYAEIGISLPHFSGAQALLGTAIDWKKEAIKPGDLVFLESSKGSGIVDHVGIAISSTQWLHAPRTGDVVRTGNIPMFRVVAVRRLVTP